MASMYPIGRMMMWWRIVVMMMMTTHAYALQLFLSNSHGDFYTQKIIVNNANNMVEMQWTTQDESQISVFINYHQYWQIFRIRTLREMDYYQHTSAKLSTFQQLCFVRKFHWKEFIDFESMTKLSHQHSRKINKADEDLGVKNVNFNFSIPMNKIIDNNIREICHGSKTVLVNNITIVNSILGSKDVNDRTTIRTANKDSLFCSKITDNIISHHCLCNYSLCLNWYPCNYKNCKLLDSQGRQSCSIASCKRCYHFRYTSDSVMDCLWDI
ncbi:Out at first protein-like protein [Trichoplax sp. H2]|nr:Out at first protein-like protein [Trichoplax sp. H2]|eukprot:RDD47662.1 Out at first protein-like protein [Trichoplax sp. H2]